MFTHTQIWEAIDRMAENTGHSTSGLAKLAGLDPTSFNKSKRQSPEGKPRWPSTESISKILAVTNLNMTDFIIHIETQASIAEKRPNISTLSIDTETFIPVYRRGDIVGVDQNTRINPGDRIALQTKDKSIFIGNYMKHNDKQFMIDDFIKSKKTIAFSVPDIDWIARIMWVKHP